MGRRTRQLHDGVRRRLSSPSRPPAGALHHVRWALAGLLQAPVVGSTRPAGTVMLEKEWKSCRTGCNAISAPCSCEARRLTCEGGEGEGEEDGRRKRGAPTALTLTVECVSCPSPCPRPPAAWPRTRDDPSAARPHLMSSDFSCASNGSSQVLILPYDRHSCMIHGSVKPVTCSWTMLGCSHRAM